MSLASRHPPTASSPRQRWLRRAALGFGALLIAVYLFVPAHQVTTVTLDDSNYTSFAYFTAKGFQYGPQVVPVVGPLGFVLYGFVYAGDLFWTRLALDLGLKFVFGALLLWFLLRSPQRLLRWAWLATVLLITPLIHDSPFDFSILLAGLFLLASLRDGTNRWPQWGACALLGVLALFKGTEFALAGATFTLLAGTAVLTGRIRQLAGFAGVFIAAFAFFWVLAGQNPVNIPSYVRGIFELSSGYNDAMALQETAGVFAVGVSVFILLELAIAIAIALRWRDRFSVAGLLLLAGFTFVFWKHGFVRADGHVLIFFWYAPIVALTAMLLSVGGSRPGSPSRPRRVGSVLLHLLAGLALVGGVYATGFESLARLRWEISQLPRLLPARVHYLAHVVAEKEQLEVTLAAQRDRYRLGRFAATVGSAGIDFYGSEHGFLPLNGLNYQPRPMGGGSFNVYTPYLKTINEAYLRNPSSRPAFMALNLGTIDERLLTQDDARSLVALLQGYSPVDTEQGLLLLAARSPQPEGPRLVAERSFRLDEIVPVPAVSENEILLATFQTHPNLLGRLRTAVYKAPQLHIDLAGDGFPPVRRRLIASMVRLPFVFSPLLETNADFLDLYSSQVGKIVRSFRLASPHSKYWNGPFTVQFHAIPRPAPLASDAHADLKARLAFPVADTPPLRMHPQTPLRNFDGYLVQMLEPPGEIVFALQGDERVVTFDFGIDPAAYTSGTTNGVEFLVEVHQGSGVRQPLFSRLLQPKTVDADRGRHAARVVLPPLGPNSTLRLRTEPGPHGDGGWDWAYFSKVRLHRGPFLPEQFPGVTVLPLAVENPSPGVVLSPAGPVFMLNAPSSLEFPLTGAGRALEFSVGLLEGAYTNGGRSDGVAIIVELTGEDGSIRPLFRHLLNPRDNEGDRGSRDFSVPLPEHSAGSRLLLRTDPGPNGDGGWDWTYLQRLDIK